MSDDDLKAELVAKAKAAGVWNAQMSWSVETLERKISEAALRDQELPPEEPEAALEGDEEIFEEVELEEVAPEATDEPAEEVSEPEPAPEPQEQPEGTVRCRVTKKGAGKIFTGQPDPKHFAWEEIIFIPLAAARQLEDRAFVEILDEPID
jgi:hypothetical protein